MNNAFPDQLLGMVIYNPKRYWPAVKNKWEPEIFAEAVRIKIAQAIKDVLGNDEVLTKAKILDRVGEQYGLLLDNIAATTIPEVNIDYYMDQIAGWYKIKTLAVTISHFANGLISANYSDSIDRVINDLKNFTAEAEKNSSQSITTPSFPDIIDSALERLESRILESMHGKPRGISFNLKKLDDAFQGLIGGRFYIIAARTSVGKTSFASWVTLQAMKQGAKPLFFSNEMDKEDLVDKFFSIETGLNSKKIQSGNMTDDELSRLTASASSLARLNLSVEEKAGWNIKTLLNTVYRLHRVGRCNMVIVDYLQQVRVDGAKTKQEQVSIVTDEMKKLSRDLNIPVIGLAQINRESEKGSTRDVPNLSHLKDSGSLEQDADAVMILHRPDPNVIDDKVPLILSIAKNRYGQTGYFDMVFHSSTNSYQLVDKI